MTWCRPLSFHSVSAEVSYWSEASQKSGENVKYDMLLSDILLLLHKYLNFVIRILTSLCHNNRWKSFLLSVSEQYYIFRHIFFFFFPFPHVGGDHISRDKSSKMCDILDWNIWEVFDTTTSILDGVWEKKIRE